MKPKTTETSQYQLMNVLELIYSVQFAQHYLRLFFSSSLQPHLIVTIWIKWHTLTIFKEISAAGEILKIIRCSITHLLLIQQKDYAWVHVHPQEIKNLNAMPLLAWVVRKTTTPNMKLISMTPQWLEMVLDYSVCQLTKSLNKEFNRCQDLTPKNNSSLLTMPCGTHFGLAFSLEPSIWS